MNLETRKLNLINWISSIQEDTILDKVEKIQQEKTDWWDVISDKDKKAIDEGIAQLDKGEHLTHSQVRSKIKERFNFK
ncbi:MAG: hypothetical protein Q8P34_04935 [Bacteroidota bacterium]|nr:hypothetical protein [Bacteroidota bacterium]